MLVDKIKHFGFDLAVAGEVFTDKVVDNVVVGIWKGRKKEVTLDFIRSKGVAESSGNRLGGGVAA